MSSRMPSCAEPRGRRCEGWPAAPGCGRCEPMAGPKSRPVSRPLKRCFVSRKASTAGCELRAANTALSRNRSGFTRIEILVVLAIIATLAALVGPSVFRNVGDSRAQAARSQLELFALALEQYRLDNHVYPGTDQGLTSLRTLPVTGESPRHWRRPYLRRVVPDDPLHRAYIHLASWRENPESYDLYSLGRDGRPGGEGEDADVTSWGGPVRQ